MLILILYVLLQPSIQIFFSIKLNKFYIPIEINIAIDGENFTDESRQDSIDAL